MSYSQQMDSPLGYIDNTDPTFQLQYEIKLQQDIKSNHDALAELNTRSKVLKRSLFAYIAEQRKHFTLFQEANDMMLGDLIQANERIAIQEETKNIKAIINRFENNEDPELLSTTGAGDAGHLVDRSSRLNETLGLGGSHIPFQDDGTATATANGFQETFGHYNPFENHESFEYPEEAGSSSHIDNAGLGSSHITIQNRGTAIAGADEYYVPVEGNNMEVGEAMTQSQIDGILHATKHLEGGQTQAPYTISSGNADILKARLTGSGEIDVVGSFIGPNIKIEEFGEPGLDENGRIMRRVHFASMPGIGHCQARSHDPRRATTYIPQNFIIVMDASDTLEKLLASRFLISVCKDCCKDVKYGTAHYCHCKKDRCPLCVFRWVTDLQRRFDQLSKSMGPMFSCSNCSQVAGTHLLCCRCNLLVREA